MKNIKNERGDITSDSTCIFFIYLFISFIYLFIYLLAVLCLLCCTRAFSSCGKQGLFFVAMQGLLITMASLVVEHRLQARRLQQLWHAGFSSHGSRALECRLSSCGTQAQLLHGMWDLLGPGPEPLSPELSGGFLTTAPPEKSSQQLLKNNFLV